MQKHYSFRNKTERLLLLAGLLLLSIYVGARISARLLSRAELQAFKNEPHGIQKLRDREGLSTKAPDFQLWSEKRIREYQQSVAMQFSSVIAVLNIPKIDLEVPVLRGTDDLTLNRGAGLIKGTSEPGQNGNIGIAAHRDGFFRGLKDVDVGDAVELTTRTAIYSYVVDQIVIVSPNDVSVLRPRSHPSLTLVTCYPFYFVGSAPQRYIVQASYVNEHPRDIQATTVIDPQTTKARQNSR